MKNLLAFLGVVFCFIFFTSFVSAQQYGCAQYGGCAPSFTILVHKMVGMPNNSNTDPTSANFVDNLSPSDPRFHAGQFIFFKVIVKNTSNSTLTNVVVKDFVPSFIDPVVGPGTFDSGSRTITFTVGSLSPGQEQDFFFKMQVEGTNQLPSDKGLFCETNQVQATSDQASGSSTSQFCIEKQVSGVTGVPSAGPEFGLILLGLNLAGVGAGLALKRKV